MKLLVFTMLVAALFDHAPAFACKIGNTWLGAPSMPPDAATVGPRPLLVITSSSIEGQLHDEAGNIIALARDPAFDEALDPADGAKAWRPVEPLAAGAYYWAWYPDSPAFFVDHDLVDEPEPFVDASFRVVIDRPDGMDACGGHDSCHDIDRTRLEVRFAAPLERTRFLLELEDRSGDDVLARFVYSEGRGTNEAGLEQHELVLFETLTDVAIGSRPICVAITPVSDSGTLGERIDLGCSNPDSGKRIVDEDGCASTTDAWTMLAALVLLGQRRLASRRAASA